MNRIAFPSIPLLILGLSMACEDRSDLQDTPGAGGNGMQTNHPAQQSDGVDVQTDTDGQGEDGVKVRVRTPDGDFNVDVEY